MIEIVERVKASWAARRAAGCEGMNAKVRCGAMLGADDGYLCRPCAAKQATADRAPYVAEALATIPPRYRWARLGFAGTPPVGAEGAAKRLSDGSATLPRVREALAVLGASTRPLAVIVGKVGQGKTTIACATLREVIRSGNDGARFVSARDLCRSVADHGLGKGPSPDFVEAASAPFLVLDDVGAGAAIGRDAVGDLISDRFDFGRPTIVTSGLTTEEARSMYGGGIQRRLFSDSFFLDLGGK